MKLPSISKPLYSKYVRYDYSDCVGRAVLAVFRALFDIDFVFV